MNDSPTPAPADTTPITPAPAPTSEWPLMPMALVASLVTLVITACALLLYHANFVRTLPRFGTVDVASVVGMSELVFAELIARPTATDVERTQAITMAQELGPKLEAALRDIERQCGCILLTKAAVVGSSIADHTPALKTAMGLDAVNEEALRMKMEQYAANPAAATTSLLGTPMGVVPAASGLGNANGANAPLPGAAQAARQP